MNQKRFILQQKEHQPTKIEKKIKPIFFFIFLDVIIFGTGAKSFDASSGTLEFEQLARNRRRKYCQS